MNEAKIDPLDREDLLRWQNPVRRIRVHVPAHGLHRGDGGQGIQESQIGDVAGVQDDVDVAENLGQGVRQACIRAVEVSV